MLNYPAVCLSLQCGVSQGWVEKGRGTKSTGLSWTRRGDEGGGGEPYKNHGGARQKF